MGDQGETETVSANQAMARPTGTGAQTNSPPSAHRAPLRARALDLTLEWGIAVAVLALILYFGLKSPYFFTSENASNIASGVAVNGILAAGLTLALICGQLDITVGPIMGLVATVFAVLTEQHGASVPVALLVCTGTALAIGIVNGVLVVNLNINSIIATIATSQIVFGAALILPNPQGQNVPLNSTTVLSNFSQGTVIGIPTPFVVMIGVFAAGFVLLTFTRLGSRIYATGGNSSAAIRAGVRAGWIYRFIFVATAVLALIGGLIQAGRAGYGGSAIGTTVDTFNALTAVLLGGIGLNGGLGRIERTLLGVLLLGVLDNGMTLTGVNSFVQEMVGGVVLCLAVVLAAIGQKRKQRG